QHLLQVLRDPRRGVFLEDPDAAIAHDVVLETLEFDTAITRGVTQREIGEIGKPAERAYRAEFAGGRDNFLVGAGVGKGLQYRGIDRLGAGERDGASFGSGHGSRESQVVSRES